MPDSHDEGVLDDLSPAAREFPRCPRSYRLPPSRAFAGRSAVDAWTKAARRVPEEWRQGARRWNDGHAISTRRQPVSVYKVIEIVGTSTTSWEDAATTAVNKAKEHLRDLRVAEVMQQDLDLTGDEVRFRVKLSLSFKYEDH